MWNGPTATTPSAGTSPPQSDRTSSGPHGVRCLNCGSVLTDNYCAHCGQRAGELRLSLRDVAHEIAAEHFGLDSKIGRTLRTLLRHPGKLTNEFLSGRRIRYVPPLRLYLSLSVLYFLLSAIGTSIGGSKPPFDVIKYQTSASDTADLGSARVQADSALRTGRTQGSALDTLHGNTVSLYFKRRLVERIAFLNTHRKEAAQQISETFQHELPDALFLLVPGLALTLMLLYHGSHRYYAEHLIFAFHFQSFSFAALTIGLIPIPLLRAIIGCVMLAYLYLSLRRVYGGSTSATIAKVTVILIGYGVALVLLMAAVGFAAFLFA